MVAKVAYWIARLLAAVILLQTLFFKFSGSDESVYIFQKVFCPTTGADPCALEAWTRIGTGVFELVAAILLLTNTLTWIGAVLALGLMVGAITIHLTLLGIEVQGDNGQLFIYACMVFLSSTYILYRNKDKVAAFLGRLRSR